MLKYLTSSLSASAVMIEAGDICVVMRLQHGHALLYYLSTIRQWWVKSI